MSNSKPYNLEIAQAYIAAGISIIPIACDGSKKTTLKSWNPHREKFATAGHLTAWFAYFNRGIGFVCGVLSGGLEVLDFDYNADETFHRFCRLIPAEIYGRLCVVETAGGGYHVIYRSPQVTGNHKIAMTADNPAKTIIESRGEGGYIVAVGSPAKVHNSGKPYVQVMGQPLPELPKFTLEERKTLWKVAASFDERSPDFVKAEYVKQHVKSLRPETIDFDFDTTTPWGDFDARASWGEILILAGWSTDDGIEWSRPGKDEPGASAKVVISRTTGVQVLTVFSTSAGELSPNNGNCRTWGKFDAYKVLHHGGDNKAAVKAVRALGYGGRSK